MMYLALVSEWVIFEKYGLAYRFRNGNYGFSFKDKLHLFSFLDPSQETNELIDVVGSLNGGG